MKWLTAENPEVGYFITEIIEERLDGFNKIILPYLGMYSVIDTDTIHVVIPQEKRENLHDVFKNVLEAKAYIENHVLSRPQK